ncbi:TPA: DUF4062 domain-containing protein [Staphylococcus aureus]|nr:DUF4062 domain-containing protein [Staphylococcus aureus]HCV3010797.1 DUF4062 domain-containing protein [Staphylococcus aureus]HCV8264942.1 DUF4062 domain-containing protein [Staphylococcus aureus]HCV8265007.1 DUF4062 domain-containing protein [Staphylococcus aureus]HCX2666662.1 DUF4062 domain-containing protein [Staphylococcus aureus]
MSNTKIKYQIFISSTYLDLIEERQAVVEAVLNSNNIPAGMELFNSSSKSQWEIITQWINESDAVILLLGSSYGTIDSEENISYTEMEYNFAKSLGKPIYVFEMNKASTESAEKSKKLDEFKTKVKENSGWIRVQDCGKNVKKLKKLDAIQRDLDTYDFLKEELYKIFMYVKTFYFQHTPFDDSYIEDIENYLLNYENNPHKSFMKIKVYDYKNFLKHLKNILILIKQGKKPLAQAGHFKLSFYEEDLKLLQKNYKATLVDIKGLNKHFYKECDRCLKAYNIFIEGINKHLYE